MKQISKRLSYANVMSSLAVFLILGGATAIAATKIGTKQLKANSVTTGKIKRNAVTTAKIKKEAISTAKIKKEAVTGAKVNEATLGTVPSATTASNLVGQTPFYIRLGFGGTQTIASNGAVSLVAVCDQNAGKDRARILMQTSQNGAVANGIFDFSGNAGKFLNPATPENERTFLITEIASGQTLVSYNFDQGWVIGPDNKMLTANSEGIAIGVNFQTPGCIFAGIVNAVN